MNTNKTRFYAELSFIFKKYGHSGGFTNRALNQKGYESFFTFSEVHMRTYQKEAITEIKKLLKKYDSILEEDDNCKYIEENDSTIRFFRIEDFSGIEYTITVDMNNSDFINMIIAAEIEIEKERLLNKIQINSESKKRVRL